MKRIFRKACRVICNCFLPIASSIRKGLFSSGKRDYYIYGDEIFCDNKSTFEKNRKKYSAQNGEYWNNVESFSIKQYFPKTYSMAKSLIFDDFLPLYGESPILMDIGCASGEWTFFVAPKCKEIDGFEFSQKMVETANNQLIISGLKNIHFYQADASTIQLNREYDGAMILAMLMYFDDKEFIHRLLKNVYNHLKPGAYLCTRDTLNDEKRDIVYLLNKRSGYTAYYWNKEIYYEQFFRAGFKLKKEIIFERVNSKKIGALHIGNIWQKPID